MPKNRGWFRVYDRVLDDAKIVQLDNLEFSFLVQLWCIASAEGKDGKLPYNEGTICCRLRGWVKEQVSKIIKKLTFLNLLKTTSEGNLLIPKWRNHQYEYKSKTPDYRRTYQQKYRQQNKTSEGSNQFPSSFPEGSMKEGSLDKNRIDKNTPTLPSPQGKEVVVDNTPKNQQPKKAFSDKLFARLQALKIKADLTSWNEADIWDVIKQAETKNGTGALPCEQMAGYVVKRLQELGHHEFSEEEIAVIAKTLRNSEASGRGYWPPSGLTERQATIKELQRGEGECNLKSITKIRQ